jgi:methyl-accepting chemotaxis protein
MFAIKGSRSRSVLEALDRSLAIIEFDPQGKILDANSNFCRAMGYDRAEILGRHHSIFVDPENADGAEYREFWDRLRRGEFETREFRRLGKGGREVWIQASYNPVKNARGRVVKVVKFATDITKDKIQGLEAEGKMAAFMRSQAVIEFEVDGRIITANENFLNVMGYSLDEIRGRHHRMFVDPSHASSREYEELWRALAAGEFVAAEFKRLGKGGREVWIQGSYNPIFDLNGRVTKVVKFATDVTGRVRAVNEIAAGLARLADNDLQHRVEQPLDPAFEKLRVDFNHSVGRLQSAVRQVAVSATTIQTGIDEISASSDDLSRRTEQQAASLEETAAALDEITATVARSAEGARRAMEAASSARADAAKSGEVMNEAIAAMGEIDKSSDQITQIIGVIDEIAFQTSLLALNAGVEAARAGDAGRGFAVVAQEVRALAQRSADAAKEIKRLIVSSSDQVKRGVRLVGETDVALGAIVTKVGEIDALISEMAHSSQEQATGLGQVNSAVNQMDRVTQQNAAMVEQTTAAAANLKAEADAMTRLMAEFNAGALGEAPRPGRDSAPRLVAGAGQASGGGRVPPSRSRMSAALKIAEEPAIDDWQEF